MRALILLIALVVVLTWLATAAVPVTTADRMLVLELRMDELGRQHQLLIGLLTADFLGTLALLRRRRD